MNDPITEDFLDALEKVHIEELKILINANPDFCTSIKPDGQPMALAATCNGSASSLEFILEQGCNVNSQDAKGFAPIHAAMIIQDPQRIEVLIRYQVDLNIEDNEGNTPLHYGIQAFTGETELITAILKKGAKPTKKNKEGKSALDLAKESQNESLIKLFED